MLENYRETRYILNYRGYLQVVAFRIRSIASLSVYNSGKGIKLSIRQSKILGKEDSSNIVEAEVHTWFINLNLCCGFATYGSITVATFVIKSSNFKVVFVSVLARSFSFSSSHFSALSQKPIH